MNIHFVYLAGPLRLHTNTRILFYDQLSILLKREIPISANIYARIFKLGTEGGKIVGLNWIWIFFNLESQISCFNFYPSPFGLKISFIFLHPSLFMQADTNLNSKYYQMLLNQYLKRSSTFQMDVLQLRILPLDMLDPLKSFELYLHPR